MDFGEDDAAGDRPTYPDDPSGQHGPLRAQLENLEARVNAKSSSEDLGQILDALTDDFRHHFETEERAMERGEYALIEDHRDSHVKFMGHLEALRREYAAGRGGLSRAVIEQLKNWFEDHVHTADADAFKFLGFGR